MLKESFKYFVKYGTRYLRSLQENTAVHKKCECEVLMVYLSLEYGVMKFDPAPLIRLFFTHW